MTFINSAIDLFSQKVVGVEIVLTHESPVFNYTLVSKNKGKLKIEKWENGKDSNSKEFLKYPLILTFSGKGIITRKINELFNSSPEELIGSLLPNVDSDNYYYSALEHKGGCIVSIGRRDSIDLVISDLVGMGGQVEGINLSFMTIQSVLPLMNSEHISAGGFDLIIKESSIAEFSPAKKLIPEYELAGEILPGEIILSAASAINYFINPEDHISSKSELVENSDWKNKVKFKKMSVIIGGVFAILIFVNLFLFLFFSNQNSRLTIENAGILGQFNKLEKLKKEAEEKEVFLKKAGWLNSPKTSFFCDRIAATVPPSVSIHSIFVNPLNDQESTKLNTIIFETSKIIIKGSCKTPVVLNPWINDLKNFSWVVGVSNKKYHYDYKSNEGFFELEIEIDA